MGLTFNQSKPAKSSPYTISRVPFVHKYVGFSVSGAGTPKSVAAGRGATRKRVPMKIMPIAINAINQNSTEFVVR